MTSGHQDTEEQNGTYGRTPRQPFTYSADLYDNLGHGEDTTRRRRSDIGFDSPPPNYSNDDSGDRNSPYTDYHSGNNGFSHHSHIDNGYYSHEQDYDDRRGSLRTGNNFHQQNQQPRSKRTSKPKRALPSDRLWQPRYLIERAEKRQQQKESEQVDYDTSFHANLPKNLQHVRSRFRDPDLIKRNQAEETGLKRNPEQGLFKAYIPKQLEHVTSRFQDPNYINKSPRGQNEPEPNQEESIFRAKPPKQLEHVGSRHRNEEYFKKKELKTENPDRHQTEFHPRLPENLQYVQSRILDPSYQYKEPPQDYHEEYDRTFKARLPKRLEHVQSKLLDPTNRDKSRAADSTDEQQYYKPEFKARPPKKLEHVEKRIYDSKYFQPKPKPPTPTDEDVFGHEFKSRPPKALATVESRILDPKYFRKKSPVIPPIKPEDELKPNFKSKPPRDLEYIQSRVYDPKYFQKQSAKSSPSQTPNPPRRGPVAIIKVKSDRKAEIRPPQGNSYSERLALKKAEEESYYEVWHKQFQDEVNRKVRSNPETPKTVIAVVSEDKRVKKFGKKHKENVLPPIQTDERPIQSEGNDRKKPRMPWLKKKKKVSTVDREFFDKWISIPDTVFNQNHNSVNKKRRSVPEVWTNNEYNYDYQQPFESARRQEYVGYYGDY